MNEKDKHLNRGDNGQNVYRYLFHWRLSHNQGNDHDKMVLYICEMGLLKKTPNKNNYRSECVFKKMLCLVSGCKLI